MGRVATYRLGKIPIGVIVKGKTRFSAYEKNKTVPFIFSYESDIINMLQSGQFFRCNSMMIDDASMSRHCTDYTFPDEGALLYFSLDQYSDTREPLLVVHTEIGEKGDGW